MEPAGTDANVYIPHPFIGLQIDCNRVVHCFSLFRIAALAAR